MGLFLIEYEGFGPETCTNSVGILSEAFWVVLGLRIVSFRYGKAKNGHFWLFSANYGPISHRIWGFRTRNSYQICGDSRWGILGGFWAPGLFLLGVERPKMTIFGCFQSILGLFLIEYITNHHHVPSLLTVLALKGRNQGTHLFFVHFSLILSKIIFTHWGPVGQLGDGR